MLFRQVQVWNFTVWVWLWNLLCKFDYDILHNDFNYLALLCKFNDVGCGKDWWAAVLDYEKIWKSIEDLNFTRHVTCDVWRKSGSRAIYCVNLTRPFYWVSHSQKNTKGIVKLRRDFRRTTLCFTTIFMIYSYLLGWGIPRTRVIQRSPAVPNGIEFGGSSHFLKKNEKEPVLSSVL
jgi:hypothetical protein